MADHDLHTTGTAMRRPVLGEVRTEEGART
jgi:hypothetical protein